MSAAMNLHVRNLYGRNTHHIIESMFKATGRALRKAETCLQLTQIFKG